MDGKKTYQYTENLEQSELVKSLFEMYYNDNDMSYSMHVADVIKVIQDELFVLLDK